MSALVFCAGAPWASAQPVSPRHTLRSGSEGGLGEGQEHKQRSAARGRRPTLEVEPSALPQREVWEERSKNTRYWELMISPLKVASCSLYTEGKNPLGQTAF